MGKEKNIERKILNNENSDPVPLEPDNALYSFDQAFRKYKKENPEATLWNVSAVETFCKNKTANKLNTLEVWFNIFSKY